MKNQDINEIIEQYYGFIIKTVSQTTNRYVSVVNDDAFSVALIAFNEAVEKYDEDKGPFMNFAKIVMQSRIIDHLRKESRQEDLSSLDELEEAGFEIADQEDQQQENLALEIEEWKQLLAPFDIDFEGLADEAPKHEDTRDRAVEIAEKSSSHPPITEPLMEKKRLPIKLTAEYNQVTTKVIQRSKNFIISLILVFMNRLTSIAGWVKSK